MPQQVLRAGSVTLDPAAPRAAVVDRHRRLEPDLTTSNTCRCIL
jgi:hypothetical protein